MMRHDHTDDNPQSGRRGRRAVIIGLAALVLVVLAVTGWLLSRPDNPTLVGDNTATGIITMDARPLASAGGFAGIVMPGPGHRDETVTFQAVPTVHFRTNSAAATARIAVCTRAVGETPYGDGRIADLDVACSQVRYVKNGVGMHWVEGGNPKLRDYLIVVVKPTRAGTATVDRALYDYALESGESGKDTGELDFTVRAK